MTSKHFFLVLVVLVVNTGTKNYGEIFSEKSRIAGKCALMSHIFNDAEGSWSSLGKMILPSELSVYCHYFMEAAKFLDRRKLLSSNF